MHAAVDWGGGVSDAWTTVATFVPRLVVFLIILLVGWLVARLLSRLTGALLRRAGFERAVQRGGLGETLARGGYDASGLVARLVYLAVLLLALVLAFDVFGPNPISDLLSSVLWFLPRLAVAIVIVVVAAWIAAAVKDLVGAALGNLSYGRLLARLAWVFILGLGIIAALNQIGVATTVTLPVLITVLATVGGILVVGVGGGLIRPMQQRWERWLVQAEAETPRLREELRTPAPVPSPVSAPVSEPVSTRVSEPARPPVTRVEPPVEATTPVEPRAEPTVGPTVRPTVRPTDPPADAPPRTVGPLQDPPAPAQTRRPPEPPPTEIIRTDPPA